MPPKDGYFLISTHALTWSATSFYIYSKTMERISTHALTWSATLFNAPEGRLFFDFNSRAHVERDAKSDKITPYSWRNFNSRAHVERDC